MFIKCVTGWGAGAAPGALACACFLVAAGRPSLDAAPAAGLMWMASALTFGILGTLLGAWAAASDTSGSPVLAAALAGSVVPGIIAGFLVFGVFFQADPLGWLAVVGALFLPGPLAGATTAWLLQELPHGTA